MSGELDERLAAALERAGQALRVQMAAAARAHGLSATQLQVLQRLAGDPPERRRVGALAAELDVMHPTVSDAVTVLRRKGLVEREAPSRRAALALTAAGRAVADDLEGWSRPTLEALAGLAAADKAVALRVVLDVIGALQRAGAISVARTCSSCRFFRRDAHPEAARPHHCALLDAPLADAELRVDCPEHEPRAA